MKNKTRLYMKLNLFALTLLLATNLGLTSCCSDSNKNASDLQSLQPSVLRLLPNQQIKTLDGVYTSHANDNWYSQKSYTDLQNQLLYKQ